MNKPIDISETVLKTERLQLRPWRISDLDDFYEYASVEGVGPMAGWIPHQSKEESRRILEKFISHRVTFACDYKGKVIGSLGIERYNEERFPEFAELQGRELGFVLSKAYWGQGLMPEAVRAVISYLFDREGLDFILCTHYTDNPQSARVQAKCGFVPYKEISLATKLGIVKPSIVNLLKNPHKPSEACGDCDRKIETAAR